MSSRSMPVVLVLGLSSLLGCPSTPPPGGVPTARTPGALEAPVSPPVSAELGCVPATCEFLVASCGERSDGCGGVLQCGTCAAGQTCGGDGLPNVCSARASTPAVQWLETFPAGVSGLATGRGSTLFLLRQTRRNNVVTLLGADGSERWTRSDVAPNVNFTGLSVATSGELLAWGRHEAGGGTGASLYRFDATGAVLGLERADHLPEQLFQDGEGNLLGYDATPTSALVRYQPRQGRGWALRSTPRWAFPPVEAWDPFHFQTVALDPRGGAFVTGFTRGRGSILGQALGQAEQPSPFVLKVSAEGRLERAWELPDTEAALRLIGVSETGRLVGQGHYVGRLRWPGGALNSGDQEQSRPFLMSLDAQGRLAWVQPLPWPLDTGMLAVSAQGRTAVVNGFNQAFGRDTYAAAVHVRVYDVQGQLEWSRTFSPTEASGAVFAGGVDWSGEQLVLGGSFYGSVNFGTGPQQGSATTGKGFVLKFR